MTGVSAVKNVVEDGRKEVAQIQHLQMEELIVQKNMDLEIKKVATKKNALVSTKNTFIFLAALQPYKSSCPPLEKSQKKFQLFRTKQNLFRMLTGCQKDRTTCQKTD